MSAALVVLAAGSGERAAAGGNKVLVPLGRESALAYAVRRALAVADVRRLVLVVRPEDRDTVAASIAPVLGEREALLVNGGTTRHESEVRALAALRADIEADEVRVVAIHDSARPLASTALWEAVIAAATEHGGAVPLVPVPGLLRRDLTRVPDEVGAVQTPQAFAARPLLAAYDAAARDGFAGTDTAACLERYTEVRIVAVRGEATNLKVTWPGDLAVAARLLDA